VPTLTRAAGTQLARPGANINVGAGTLVLDAQGQGATASSDNAPALTASQLLLKGQQASFDLSRGTHAIGTLAAQVGSLKLVNAGALNVGSVAGVHGITAAQGITLQAQGNTADLTLTQAVRNASGDMVLAAGRDFVNLNAPGTGLDAGIGRYLVYSSSPTGSTEGMTVEHKRYNQTYTAGVTPTYAASGNWFLYSVAPVITVSAGATTSIYGDAIGTIATPVFSGFIDGDTADTAGITGMVNLHVATGTLSSAGHRGVGTYATSLGSLSAMASALGYTFVAGGTSGTHTVTHKAVNLSGSRVYDGTTLVAAADLSVMAGILALDAVTLSGEGSSARDVGQNHAVALDTLALGGADGGNYVIDGAQLTITPRTLTVTAEDRSKVYGDADPSLGYQIGGLGLAAGDSQDSVFSGALSTVTGAAATAGTHAITQGDLALASGNYVLGGFADGTLTVDKAQLTLKADDQSKTFGTPTPALSYTVDASGLHYGDRADVVTGVSLSAPGVAQATVGTHAITVSGAVADNYEVTMQSGTLTVNAETVKSENLVTLVPVPTVIGSAVGPQVTARLDGGVIFVPPTAQPSLAVLPGSVSVVGGGLGVSAPALTPPAAAPVAAVDSLAPSAIATPAPAAPAPVMPLTSFTKPAGKAFSIPLSEIGLPKVDGAGGEGISVMARQADGRPLPSWLKFDPVTGTLSGTPPRGFTGKLELSFTTRDSQGQTSNQPLSLSFSG